MCMLSTRSDGGAPMLFQPWGTWWLSLTAYPDRTLTGDEVTVVVIASNTAAAVGKDRISILSENVLKPGWKQAQLKRNTTRRLTPLYTCSQFLCVIRDSACEIHPSLPPHFLVSSICFVHTRHCCRRAAAASGCSINSGNSCRAQERRGQSSQLEIFEASSVVVSCRFGKRRISTNEPRKRFQWTRPLRRRSEKWTKELIGNQIWGSANCYLRGT